MKTYKQLYSKYKRRTFFKKYRHIISGIALLAAIGWFISAAEPETSAHQLVYAESITIIPDTVPVLEQDSISVYDQVAAMDAEWSMDEAVKVVCLCEAWYPDIILAQMQLESGCFKSNLGKNANNGFGMMKVKGKRPHVQLEKPHGRYARYSSWQMSVLDRVMWDSWTFSYNKPTRNDYISKLASIYAEDPSYRSKIEKAAAVWAKRISDYQSSPAVF